MRTLSYYQRAWDDRHPDDYRTAADDAAEQAAECMADFDRREAERIEVRHECRVCHGHGTLNGRDSCWRCAGSRPNGTVMCGGRECEICELERVSELHAVHVAAQEELLARMRARAASIRAPQPQGPRECEICGMPAQETGTEPRCEAHDSEVER